MSRLSAVAVRTSIFHTGQDLEKFVWENVGGQLAENDVVAVTSKIVSLAENRLVSRAETSKAELVNRESDEFLCETSFGVMLTLKHGLLLPSGGIDESNSERDDFILYPRDPHHSARRLGEELRQRSGLKNLGVILTDSHTTPLRKGVTGIGLAHWGFRAIRSEVGRKDLFGRKLKMTTINVLDALSVAAVLTMGERDESQPLAILQYDKIEFTTQTASDEIKIPLEEDLYGPLLLALRRREREPRGS